MNIEQIRIGLTNSLAEAMDIADPAESLSLLSSLIRQALQNMKEHIISNGFENPAEEIIFFKKIKPETCALQVEAVGRYNLALNEPVDTTEMRTAFWEEQLRSYQHFFRLNAFLYHYYKYGATELDTLYFIRSAPAALLTVSEAPVSDPGFSTSMDHLFSKFIGYERLQRYCLEQIAVLKYPQFISSANATAPSLKWTGDSINLVELAFGLYLTGQFNNGNASLNQIVACLELNFHTKITPIHRRFAEISRRKRLSRTKFLDQMSTQINRKIDDSL